MLFKYFFIFILCGSLFLNISCVKNDENSLNIKPDSSPTFSQEENHIDDLAEMDIEEGILFYQKGQYDEALKFFNHLLETHPNSSKLWTYKGLICAATEQYENAILCYEKSLNIKGNDGKTWHYKGLSLMELGKTEEAVECFERAMAFDPDYMKNRDRISVIDNSALGIVPTEVPPPPVPPTPMPYSKDLITEIKTDPGEN